MRRLLRYIGLIFDAAFLEKKDMTWKDYWGLSCLKGQHFMHMPPYRIPAAPCKEKETPPLETIVEKALAEAEALASSKKESSPTTAMDHNSDRYVVKRLSVTPYEWYVYDKVEERCVRNNNKEIVYYDTKEKAEAFLAEYIEAKTLTSSNPTTAMDHNSDRYVVGKLIGAPYKWYVYDKVEGKFLRNNDKATYYDTKEEAEAFLAKYIEAKTLTSSKKESSPTAMDHHNDSSSSSEVIRYVVRRLSVTPYEWWYVYDKVEERCVRNNNKEIVWYNTKEEAEKALAEHFTVEIVKTVTGKWYISRFIPTQTSWGSWDYLSKKEGFTKEITYYDTKEKAEKVLTDYYAWTNAISKLPYDEWTDHDDDKTDMYIRQLKDKGKWTDHDDDKTDMYIRQLKDKGKWFDTDHDHDEEETGDIHIRQLKDKGKKWFVTKGIGGIYLSKKGKWVKLKSKLDDISYDTKEAVISMLINSSTSSPPPTLVKLKFKLDDILYDTKEAAISMLNNTSAPPAADAPIPAAADAPIPAADAPIPAADVPIPAAADAPIPAADAPIPVAYGGFPVRYPHCRWGMEYEELPRYEELSRGYEFGVHKAEAPTPAAETNNNNNNKELTKVRNIGRFEGAVCIGIMAGLLFIVFLLCF